MNGMLAPSRRDRKRGKVRVVCHSNVVEEAVAGMSVREVRHHLGPEVNASPSATALLDNVPVDEETVVPEGRELEFLAPTATNG